MHETRKNIVWWISYAFGSFLEYVTIGKNTRSFSDKTVIVLKKVYEQVRMLRT